MAKEGFLKKDSFAALLITLIFILAIIFDAPFLRNLEHIAYDAGVRMTNRHVGAAEQIAIVAIDDESLRQLGRWPWSRNLLADMITQLSKARAKVISLQISLGETQSDPTQAYLRSLQDYMNTSRLPKLAPKEWREMTAMLKTAEQQLDADTHLAQVLRQTHNTILPMLFRRGTPLRQSGTPLPEFIQRNRMLQVSVLPAPHPPMPPSAVGATYPLETFGVPAAGIGYLNVIPDDDGAVRADPLIFEYYGDFYPSLALLIAAKSLNLNTKDIVVALGDNVRLGRLSIQTDEAMRMYSGFYRADVQGRVFPTYSFAAVRAGKVPPETFNNKIVLIGTSAASLGDTQVTPVSADMSGPVLTANMVASILNQDYYQRPDWAMWVEPGIYVGLLLYLMFLLPSLSVGPAAFMSLSLFIGLLGGGHYLLISQQLWLQTVSPALLLLIGHLLLTTKHFFTPEQHKVQGSSDAAQTNRLLGLSFQGQGQLDMALDKFLSLPVDNSVLELIYNLALDFERKRQFNKAAAAYDYIRQHSTKFRDVGQRRKQAQKASNSLRGGGQAGLGDTLILDNAGEKPTLGRYRVEKELGKGAMGAVYLGRDPKINRVVAIKTLALGAEFADSELASVKTRFFREAETAGRLNHPNIVTIYDAGEEHDLAYIAMEFLAGKDLTHYTRPDALLPVDQVAAIVCSVAEALDYAHRNHVVHRDIKPANIMYDVAQAAVKVTDFGIARITADKSTKTGVILGSPSYMSPEQLAGRPVDGRSDLFSLGVMLYELLTGSQPFQGDSMATLMYQIANERHPDITQRRPDLPACLTSIIDRALHKNPDDRFQTGAEFSLSLRDCLCGELQIDLGAA
jgi:eukaryotic-like serine/threonine-protein kinase